MDQEPLPPPSPLEYRDGSADRPAHVANTGRMIGGAIGGVAAVAFVGFVGFLANLGNMEQPPAHRGPRPWAWVGFFAAVAVVGSVAGCRAIRKPRRRFLLAGFLLGLGLCALCEGLCFSGM